MTWNEDPLKRHYKTTIARNIKNRDLKKKESLKRERGLTDIQEDTDPQLDRCQCLNDDVTTTVSSERLQKPPVTRKDDFYGWT